MARDGGAMRAIETVSCASADNGRCFSLPSWPDLIGPSPSVWNTHHQKDGPVKPTTVRLSGGGDERSIGAMGLLAISTPTRRRIAHTFSSLPGLTHGCPVEHRTGQDHTKNRHGTVWPCHPGASASSICRTAPGLPDVVLCTHSRDVGQ